MTRLPGCGGGSYYPHRRMGGVAHGFVWPPPRLAAETMTTAASAGGLAGFPPRLRARQQAHAAALNNNDENKDNLIQRAMKAPAAGDTIIDDCWTAGNDKEESIGQAQTTTNHCALMAG